MEQEGDEEREELQQLLSRRRQLVEQRVQDRSRLDKGISASVGKSTRRHISWLDKEIERLDKEYIELLKHSDNLCRQADLYRSVPGVGQLTAATLVAYLPELGQRDSKALTSLVGLAPWSRDSGKKRGNRSIRGGRSTVRAVLYMAAMSVIRVEGVNKRFYQGLRKRGKVGKVALVAVMRKMLLHLNAVARRGDTLGETGGVGICFLNLQNFLTSNTDTVRAPLGKGAATLTINRSLMTKKRSVYRTSLHLDKVIVQTRINIQGA